VNAADYKKSGHRPKPGSWLPRINFMLVGEDAVKASLRELATNVQKDIIRQGVRSAMGPVAAQTRKNIKAATKGSDQSTGHLYRNIVIKVQQSRKQPTKVYGIVGARRGNKEKYVIVREFKDRNGNKSVKSHAVVVRKASRYLHLLENGFMHHAGFFVPGRKVLRRAAEATKGVALSRMHATIARLIPNAVARARSKARARTRGRNLTGAA
jgi:hypothetical protein